MKLTETLLSINLFFQQNVSTTIFTLLASSYIASKTTPENEISNWNEESQRRKKSTSTVDF